LIARTSVTDPIRVDFVAAALTPFQGRLGLTFAPGKTDSGRTGEWRRDLDTDLARLRAAHSADLLVSLVEDAELVELGIEDLAVRTAAHGLDFVRHPFVDGSVPDDASAFEAFVERLVAQARDGRSLVVHCKGGLGRSGLVAACCLVACGHDPDFAIAAVRCARHGAVETAPQAAFVRRFRRPEPAGSARWIFACGSNMHLGDLARAIPDLRGLLRAEPATLEGWRVVWNHDSKNRGGGVANVEASEGATCPGVALLVLPELEERIDHKEGLRARKPSYSTREVTVSMRGTTVPAKLYVSARPCSRPLAHASGYGELLLEAATAWDLPTTRE